VCDLGAAVNCPDCDAHFCSSHIYPCSECDVSLCGTCLRAHDNEPHWRDPQSSRELAGCVSGSCEGGVSERRAISGAISIDLPCSISSHQSSAEKPKPTDVVQVGPALKERSFPKPTANTYVLNSVRCAAPACNEVREGSERHWFITLVRQGDFRCRPYDPEVPLQTSEQPVCGQACALRLFDHYLAIHACRKQRDSQIISPGTRSPDPDISSNSGSGNALSPVR
jgi:hypothetical protein